MSSEIFAAFDSRGTSATIAAGSLLFRPGDTASGLYTIRKGKVALIWSDTNKVQPMDTLGPGEIIGLPAALNGEYSMGARAVQDCELGFVPATVLTHMLQTNPRLLELVTRMLASEVARMRSLVTGMRKPKGGMRVSEGSRRTRQ
jgi:CRP-like cAMP-binding protein